MGNGKNRTNSEARPLPDAESSCAGEGRRGFAKDSVKKNYAIAFLGEFVGTFLFLFFAFAGTQAAKFSSTDSDGKVQTTPQLLLYISFAFGFSLAVNVWLFYRVSGGLFNPAVTYGFVLLGLMPATKAVLLVIAQLLGGIAASGVVCGITGALDVQNVLSREYPNAGSTTSVAQGLFLEVFLTAELSLTIFMLAVEKHRATHLAPLVIGLSLFICHLVGVYFTGASLNPARSFGPAVVGAEFPGHHWIFWLGPLLGTTLAAGLYKLLLVVDYKTANPGQDSDGLDATCCGSTAAPPASRGSDAV
ncbi:aquaporin-1 [Geopyxis carbonaria]|nr:aquaporin-1 [Geopyxis carbonaria]